MALKTKSKINKVNASCLFPSTCILNDYHYTAHEKEGEQELNTKSKPNTLNQILLQIKVIFSR